MKACGTMAVNETTLVILKQTAEKEPGTTDTAHDTSALSENRAGES